jgi:hypothetical protein
LTGGQHFRTWKGVRGDYVLPFIISARYWIEVAAGGKNWYRQRVIQAGASPLFRQAFVEATGHCNFPARGLHRRAAAAAASGFGSFDPHVRFRPPPLVNSLFPR